MTEPENQPPVWLHHADGEIGWQESEEPSAPSADNPDVKTKSLPASPPSKKKESAPPAKSTSASTRATEQVRRGELLSAANPKERSPKQENL